MTFKLSSKASVEYGCSKCAGAVKMTWLGITCPSMTFLSIMSGRGGGYKQLPSFDELAKFVGGKIHSL